MDAVLFTHLDEYSMPGRLSACQLVTVLALAVTPAARAEAPLAPVADNVAPSVSEVFVGGRPLVFQQGGYPHDPPASFTIESPTTPGPVSPWPMGLAGHLDHWLDDVTLRGWVDQGYTWNPDKPANRFNGPLTPNDRANEYQLNQLYLTIEKPVCMEGCAWDLGGRVDLLYGTDYFFTTAAGLETSSDGSPRWNSSDGPRGGGAAMYGLALPQLYAELFAPVGHGMSLMLGHFYTTMGHESVMATDNFFYSHSYATQYGEPKTHTGLVASYDLNPCLNMHAGLTRGWDAWEDINDDLGLLAGFAWSSPSGRTALAFALHTGDEDLAGRNNRTSYSIVLRHQLNPCLVYILQHDLGVEADAETNRNFQQDSAKWYGINQALIHQMSPTLAAGGRFEWFRDQDNARVLGIPLEAFVDGGNYYALTLGLNWNPHQHVTLRPELRWDWSDTQAPALDNQGLFDNFGDQDQMTIAMDVIVTF